MLQRKLRVTILVALLVCTLVLIIARVVDASLNHDEHQFLAPAELWARNGLLPYRDFPMFHMPNLVFVYGLLCKTTVYKLLATRIFCGVCAWLVLVFIVVRSYRLLAKESDWFRLG